MRIDHTVDLNSDTTFYQLREVVGDTFMTGDEVSYRIERYIRPNEEAEWQIDSIWSARINTYQAIMVENNVPIIKLSFPLEEDRRWDGNAMNAREYDQFKMIDLGASFIIDDQEYSNTLEMIKEDAVDPTQRVTDNIHKERYAEGIGMIYRIDIDRNYCSVTNCSESGIIEFGLEIEYKLIEYLPVE